MEEKPTTGEAEERAYLKPLSVRALRALAAQYGVSTRNVVEKSELIERVLRAQRAAKGRGTKRKASPSAGSPVRIRVKSLVREFELTVPLSWSGRNLKEAIRGTEHVEPRLQKLFFKGKPLDDSTRLSDAGMVDGDTVIMALAIGERDAVAAEPTAAYARGDRVRITGLVKASHYNNLEGVVQRAAGPGGRYPVLLAALGKKIKIKPNNLRLIARAPAPLRRRRSAEKAKKRRGKTRSFGAAFAEALRVVDPATAVSIVVNNNPTSLARQALRSFVSILRRLSRRPKDPRARSIPVTSVIYTKFIDPVRGAKDLLSLAGFDLIEATNPPGRARDAATPARAAALYASNPSISKVKAVLGAVLDAVRRLKTSKARANARAVAAEKKVKEAAEAAVEALKDQVKGAKGAEMFRKLVDSDPSTLIDGLKALNPAMMNPAMAARGSPATSSGSNRVQPRCDTKTVRALVNGWKPSAVWGRCVDGLAMRARVREATERARGAAQREGQAHGAVGVGYWGETDAQKRPHGYGIAVDASGDVHVGMFEKGRPYGYGRSFNGMGHIVTVSEGDFQGPGGTFKGVMLQLRLSASDRHVEGAYMGGFRRGKRHGWGKVEDVAGHFFSGDQRGGLPHGDGVQIMRTADGRVIERYWGEYKQGIKHGSGVLHAGVNAELVYEGDFARGMPNGHGSQVNSSSRQRFQGNFTNGQCHGAGVVVTEKDPTTSMPSTTFAGTFREGSPDGVAVITFGGEVSSFRGMVFRKPVSAVSVRFQDGAASEATPADAAELQKTVAMATEAQTRAEEARRAAQAVRTRVEKRRKLNGDAPASDNEEKIEAKDDEATRCKSSPGWKGRMSAAMNKIRSMNALWAGARSAKKRKGRCRAIGCRRRLGLDAFECRCGLRFCPLHRLPADHECTFDYKAEQMRRLRQHNLKLEGDRGLDGPF